MVGLFAQIETFLLTFVLGIITAIIFHYYQSTIHNLRIGRYALYIMDFILWIMMIIIIAVSLYIINQGEIRVYVFIGLVAGGIVYYISMARFLKRPIYFLGRATAAMLQTVIYTFMKPLRLAVIWLKEQYKKRKKSPPPDNTND
ncbi:MAG: spore cortex biosynthesis protein YabQ [Syntrophomonas sp.]|nr:spore cortex biosynthesis protein YabQ [Syntrophomonas sp.]